MAGSRGNRFTIFDALDAAGYFDKNPANAFARDKTTGENLYQGPVEYPKMLYHPEGEEEVTRAGEVVVNPLTGPAMLNEHRAMIHRIVRDSEEEAEALADGWHPHPALAIRSRVEAFIKSNEGISEKEKAKLLAAIPAISSDQRIKDLESEIKRLTKLQGLEQSKAELDEAGA